jgi:hypothetical protein
MGYITKNKLKNTFQWGVCNHVKFLSFPQHHAERIYDGLKAELKLLIQLGGGCFKVMWWQHTL